MLHLVNVLESGDLAKANALIEQAEFVGREITGNARITDNLQVLRQDDVAKKMTVLVKAALNRQPEYQSYARPMRIAVNINRYETGMSFDIHNDAGLVSYKDMPPMRTDFSLTLFLSAPDTYDGGELVMVTPYGEVPIKLPAGDAILYPSNMLHRVEKITRGVRIGVFCWIQSRIRDEQERLLVYQLNTLLLELMADGAKTSYVHKVGNTYNNLLRMWAEN